MTRIVTTGVAVVDFVFFLDEMPRLAEKYRANGDEITGGGGAANAAAAIARLGGHAMLASRLGSDQVADMIAAGLEADGVDCTMLRRFEGCRSSFSSVFIDKAGERLPAAGRSGAGTGTLRSPASSNSGTRHEAAAPPPAWLGISGAIAVEKTREHPKPSWPACGNGARTVLAYSPVGVCWSPNTKSKASVLYW